MFPCQNYEPSFLLYDLKSEEAGIKLFTSTGLIPYCLVIIGCPKIQTIKPKCMLLSPREKRRLVCPLRSCLLSHQCYSISIVFFTIIIHFKAIFEQKVADYQRSRFCRRNPVPEAERSFHVGLQLCSGGRQRFNKLVWIHHSCHITYRYLAAEKNSFTRCEFWKFK